MNLTTPSLGENQDGGALDLATITRWKESERLYQKKLPRYCDDFGKQEAESRLAIEYFGSIDDRGQFLAWRDGQ